MDGQIQKECYLVSSDFEYVLEQDKVCSIGRDPANVLAIASPAISRFHAIIRWSQGSYLLCDLKSNNGTFVNKKRIQTSHLKDGDKIRVGKNTFTYQEKIHKPRPVPKEIVAFSGSMDNLTLNEENKPIIQNLEEDLLPLPNSLVSSKNKRSKSCNLPQGKAASSFHDKKTMMQVNPPKETTRKEKTDKKRETSRREKTGSFKKIVIPGKMSDEDRFGTIEGYTLIEKKAMGEMSTVYLAEDLKNKEMCIVKILISAPKEDAKIKRFLRELRINMRLNHPHIARLLDFGRTSKGIWFFVMEYIDGIDLDDVIQYNGAIDPQTALGVAYEVASALQYTTQQNIIHRDLKPGNILLERANLGVKLIDFGIAKLQGGDKLTKSDQVFGTLFYMSPEQLQSSTNIDHRTDIYALGATLYHMLCGTPPYGEVPGNDVEIIRYIFQHEPFPVQDMIEGINENVARIIKKAMERDIEKRYQTLEDMMYDLQIELDQYEDEEIDIEDE